MTELITIPEDVNCIHPYVLTGSISVASAIVLYLVNRYKEERKEKKIALENHMNDLKEHSKSIQAISDKKTNLVLQNLENQITKLEVVLSKF